MNPISEILQRFRAPSAPQVPANSWESLAQENPNVQAWWTQLQQAHPDMQGLNMIEFMKNDPSHYNYREAVLKGLFPQVNPKFGHYHWSDYGKGQTFQAFGESESRERR